MDTSPNVFDQFDTPKAAPEANPFDQFDSAKPAPGELAPGELASAAVGGANRGIAGLLGLPVDTTENLYNLVKAGLGSIALAKDRRDLAPDLTTGTPGGSDYIASLMERLGINTGNPRPDSPVARMAYTGGTIAGGSMVPGATVKGALGAAAGGAFAGEAFGPEYTGIGAMIPGAGRMAAADLKNAVAARTAPNVEAFRQAGTTPSVGQATDLTFMHGLENLAAKLPGGAGVMQRFIESQQRQMGAATRTGVSAEEAGRAIEAGIKGEGGFLDRTRQAWKGLESQMAAKIPPDYKSPPMATLQTLDDLTRAVPGAEATTSRLANPKLIEMRDALLTDIQSGNGEIPFTALRTLRSRVGSMLDDSLVSGVPNRELRTVYDALTKDIGDAAKSAGAGPEFKRQNDYYRARMERIESTLDRVVGRDKQPEDIFKSVVPTDPDQANKLRAVMRSLAPDQREIVSDAVVNRLGRAAAGAQDEMGTVFSSERFLTNWNRLSMEAKAQLFPNSPMRENLERIAKAAASMREGKGIYSNPSGTAGSFAAYAVYMTPFAALGHVLGGYPGAALGLLSGAASQVAATNIGAKMLTSPKVVEWLATPIRLGTPQAAAHLARLSVIYNQSSPEVQQELSRYVSSLQHD